MEIEATGNSYIAVYSNKGKERFIKSMDFVRTGYSITPEIGKTYGFTNINNVWLCGKSYFTSANGHSNGIDVSNKKIQITGFSKGDPYQFSIIKGVIQ